MIYILLILSIFNSSEKKVVKKKAVAKGKAKAKPATKRKATPAPVKPEEEDEEGDDTVDLESSMEPEPVTPTKPANKRPAPKSEHRFKVLKFTKYI